mgnify:CR=1 FL=1
MNVLKDSLKVLILSLVISLSACWVFAATDSWTGPSTAPPGGNVSSPLNEGPAGQIKSGGLTLGSGISSSQVGLSVLNGNVGIGTANPGEKLDVNGAVKATKLCVNSGSGCQYGWTSWSIMNNDMWFGGRILIPGGVTGYMEQKIMFVNVGEDTYEAGHAATGADWPFDTCNGNALSQYACAPDKSTRNGYLDPGSCDDRYKTDRVYTRKVWCDQRAQLIWQPTKN